MDGRPILRPRPASIAARGSERADVVPLSTMYKRVKMRPDADVVIVRLRELTPSQMLYLSE